jgi:hypothetical protein
MISPAAHAGGGTNRSSSNGGGGSSNSAAAERRGPSDRPPSSSPIHLDQNSNKSSLARGRSGAPDRFQAPSPTAASIEPFSGRRSTGSSPHHQLVSPADRPPTSSPVAFLPPHVTGGGSSEFRPPWLPLERSSSAGSGVGGRSWLLPTTDPLLLHPLRAPLGFVAPPLLPSGQPRGLGGSGGGGPLLLPSPLDFARLAAAGGILPPLAAAAFPPHMLEQLYRHQPPSPTTSVVVVSTSSAPLPQFYSTGPETQKRKRSNSFVEEAPPDRDSRGLAASSFSSFLSGSPHSVATAADGRPPSFNSRLPAGPPSPPLHCLPADGGNSANSIAELRWLPAASITAAGVATAAALPAPIMSVRPAAAASSSSSSSSELTRPGHPAHFTQVENVHIQYSYA